MTPGRRNISIYRGDTYTHRVEVLDAVGPVDLTGSTWLAQIRRNDAQVAEFDINVADNVVTLSLTPEATTALTPLAGLRWDIQRTVGGAVETLLAGSVKVATDVSR